MEKHSSLLQTFINYGNDSFTTLGQSVSPKGPISFLIDASDRSLCPWQVF
jgi:hypothetical protein